jgi:membrane protein implicated in regulation of membrane protease activity
MGGLLLGLINIAINVVGLLFIGACVLMFAKWMGYAIDAQVIKLYLLFVMLMALYMFVALFLGLPFYRMVVQDDRDRDRPVIGATIPPPRTQVLR